MDSIFLSFFILFLIFIIPSGNFDVSGTPSCSNSYNDCRNDLAMKKIDTDCNTPYIYKHAIPRFGKLLSMYADQHILYSLYYLKLSTSMGLYENNKPGFQKLFRKLSDECWDKSQDIIKYINKRGYEYKHYNELKKHLLLNNNKPFTLPVLKLEKENITFAFTGMKTINDQIVHYVARSVDFHKDLAKNAFKIHQQAINDPDIQRYLEEEFVPKQSDTIRYLTGLLLDMTKLYETADKLEDYQQYYPQLSFYLLDEYLQHHSY